jgi:hypothetical protein
MSLTHACSQFLADIDDTPENILRRNLSRECVWLRHEVPWKYPGDLIDVILAAYQDAPLSDLERLVVDVRSYLAKVADPQHRRNLAFSQWRKDNAKT